MTVAYLRSTINQICLPCEDRKLGLDDLNPDDDEQQGANNEDDELQQGLQDSIGETVFTLQDLPQCVEQQGQGELRAAWQEGKRNSQLNMNI